MKETELAACVKAFYEKTGAQVYQEVTVRGGVADLVVVPGGGTAHCIETKVRLTWALLDQALERLKHFNLVSIAIPHTVIPASASEYIRLKGIGLILIRESTISTDAGKLTCQPVIWPLFNSEAMPCFKLFEEQKTAAPAGTNEGGRWGVLKQVEKRINEFVRAHPGVSVKDMVQLVSYPWSEKNALQMIQALLANGSMKGFRIEPEATQGRRMDERALVFPVTE